MSEDERLYLGEEADVFIHATLMCLDLFATFGELLGIFEKGAKKLPCSTRAESHPLQVKGHTTSTNDRKLGGSAGL